MSCIQEQEPDDVIGDVVVSVNPFKKLPIYEKSDIRNYEGRYKYERPPHMYVEILYYLMVLFKCGSQFF